MADVPSNATFLDAYPEFEGADEALVTNKLEAAARRTNADVFASEALAADAVMLRAATLLLRSPFGRRLRAEKPDQVYAWEYELRLLQRSATMGLRVF